MEITGTKIKLRDKTPEDFAREVNWGMDPEITRLDPQAGLITSVVAWFSIYTIKDSKHIGTCGIYNRTSHDAQLGIRIGDKNFWRKGYGTDAVNTLMDYCFTQTNVERVWLKVTTENIGARRCYKKAGFLSYGKLALQGIEFMLMERRKL